MTSNFLSCVACFCNCLAMLLFWKRGANLSIKSIALNNTFLFSCSSSFDSISSFSSYNHFNIITGILNGELVQHLYYRISSNKLMNLFIYLHDLAIMLGVPHHFRLRNSQNAEIGHTNNIPPSKAFPRCILILWYGPLKSNWNIIKTL